MQALANPHELLQTLLQLKLCEPDSLKPYYPRVRDRDDVSVYRCERSGVYVLSSCDHLSNKHYQEKSDFSYWKSGTREAALAATAEDNQRRYAQFKHECENKIWADIGTGAGGILDLMINDCKEVFCVEPQTAARTQLLSLNYSCFSTIEELPDNYFDIITLFHVLEHFTQSIHALKFLYQKLKPGGKLLIEVPHARDILLEFYQLDAFKAFTFWSEHLILHSKHSLQTFLSHCGFCDIDINGLQRYSLANHLYWLNHSKPGGHQIWSDLTSPLLDQAYAQQLSKLDMNDTIIAMANKPR